MSVWSTAICETNGIGIHYTRTGRNSLPVILLHGLTAHGGLLDPLARENWKETMTSLCQTPGGMESRVCLMTGYGYEDQAKDVVGLIQALSLPAPILIGHSMGGMTATVVAGQNPKLLRGLILADPSFLSPQVQREVREVMWLINIGECLHCHWMKSWQRRARDTRSGHPSSLSS